MRKRVKATLTYANVMATVAVFVALGGSAYAVVGVTSRDITDETIRGRDVAPNALGGRQIAEGRLGRVARARVADRIGAAGSRRLLLRCPSGTTLAAGLCFETAPRLPDTYLDAVRFCGAANLGNRRLPSTTDLVAYFSAGGEIAPGGELTSDVFESRSTPGRLDVLIVKDEAGTTTVAPAAPLEGPGGGTVRMPYRCVTAPTNVP